MEASAAASVELEGSTKGRKGGMGSLKAALSSVMLHAAYKQFFFVAFSVLEPVLPTKTEELLR
ncbi:hypothetical protein Ancab_019255 [Ancistrocladus abbreviatus]